MAVVAEAVLGERKKRSLESWRKSMAMIGSTSKVVQGQTKLVGR